MSRKISIGALCLAFLCVSFAAWSATTGWPYITAKLAQAKTQARACINLLKSVGENSILQAQIAYGPAQASSDGAIDGFTTALVQGSAPQNLPALQTYLDFMGAWFRRFATLRSRRLERRKEPKGWSTVP